MPGAVELNGWTDRRTDGRTENDFLPTPFMLSHGVSGREVGSERRRPNLGKQA